MNLNTYTEKSRDSVTSAVSEAISRHNPEVQGIHLLYVLMQQVDGLIPALLTKSGVDGATLLGRLGDEFSRLPEVSGNAGQPGLSRNVSEALIKAEKLAKEMKDEFVSVEHSVAIKVASDAQLVQIVDGVEGELVGVGESVACAIATCCPSWTCTNWPRTPDCASSTSCALEAGRAISAS